MNIEYYWNRVWGLGIAFSMHCYTDERHSQYSRRKCECKIFIGPLLVCGLIPAGGWERDI